MTAKCTGEMHMVVTKCTQGRERIDAKRKEDIHRDKVVSVCAASVISSINLSIRVPFSSTHTLTFSHIHFSVSLL
jgi:hypothetical protein